MKNFLLLFCYLFLFGISGCLTQERDNYFILTKKIDSLQKQNDLLVRQNALLNKVMYKQAETLAHDFLKPTIPVVSDLAMRIPFRNNTFDIFLVDLKKNKIMFFWADSDMNIFVSLSNVKKHVENLGLELVFATNAGMYKPDNSPQGLYIENGKIIIPIDLRQPKIFLNFYMNFGNEKRTNGVFVINKNNQADIIKAKNFKFDNTVKYATQSGPLLVYDGKINPKFNKNSKSKYIRSGVGIIDKNKIVFAISNETVNFYDFASLFRNVFGCYKAMYLDGAISRMYLPKLRRYQLGGNFGPIITIVK